jgi:hypothetical protein
MQAGGIELVWQAPAGCPRARQVLQRIRNLSGTDSTNVPPLRAEATIEREQAGQLRLHLVTHAGGLVGERTLDGTACSDLANSAAVHLALLLQASEPPGEPDGVGASREAAQWPPSTTTQTAPAPAPAASGGTRGQPAQPLAREPAGSVRSVQGLLQAPLAMLELGPLPQPALGLALAGGVRFAPYTLLLEGRARLGQRLRGPGDASVAAELDHVSVGLRGCRALTGGRFALSPCVHFEVEHLWARGSGSHLSVRTAQTTWFAAGAGLQVRLELSAWLGLVARIDAQLETARPRISVDNLGNLGQLGPAAFSFSLGSEWIL